MCLTLQEPLHRYFCKVQVDRQFFKKEHAKIMAVILECCIGCVSIDLYSIFRTILREKAIEWRELKLSGNGGRSSEFPKMVRRIEERKKNLRARCLS